MLFKYIVAVAVLVYAAAAQVTVRVGANGNTYEPADFQVKVGEPVIFQFVGGTHDVRQSAGDSGQDRCVEAKGPLLSIGQEQQEGTFRHVFDAPGVVPYFCSVGNHCAEGMVGKITVVKASGDNSSDASPSASGNSSPSASESSASSSATSEASGDTGSTGSFFSVKSYRAILASAMVGVLFL